MALEALDEAMDLMYDPDAATAVGAGQGRPADPLDVFLGSLLPGADVGNVDAYIEEIMGPGAERPLQRTAVDVPAEPAVMEEGASETDPVNSNGKDAVDGGVDLFEEDWDAVDVGSSTELLDVEL